MEVQRYLLHILGTSCVHQREERRTEANAGLRPGQKGTKKLVARFGDRLICVRYRYDTTRRKRFTTVELIVDEADWTASIPIPAEGSATGPRRDGDRDAGWGAKEAVRRAVLRNSRLVGLRVGFKETELRQKVKAVGAKWDPGQRLWMLCRDHAIDLGLQERIAILAGE